MSSSKSFLKKLKDADRSHCWRCCRCWGCHCCWRSTRSRYYHWSWTRM